MTGKRELKANPLNVLTPLLCCGIFTIFCCMGITSSIRFDESYSAFLARSSFSDIWNLTSLDTHPPLYYMSLKIWSMLFGDTIISMRFMSIFFGAIAIILSFQLFRKLFNSKISVIATFFLSISPIFVYYGQEMRMYTMVFAIIIAATLVLYFAVKTKQAKYYIIYAVLAMLGLLTNYFTVLVWLAHLICVKFRSKKFVKHSSKRNTKSKINLTSKALIKVLFGMVTVVSIVGVLIVKNRAPENYLNEVMQELAIFSDSEPIITADGTTFYGASFYSHDNVYIISSHVEEFRLHRAINIIHKNVIDNMDDFAEQHDAFWYLVKAEDGQSASSIELPVDNRMIASTITVEDYIVFRLEKI